MYYITVPECVKALREKFPDAQNILVLNNRYPLLPQLMDIPSGQEFQIYVPDEWTHEEKQRLALQVSGGITSLEISRNTVNGFKDEWAENAFWNYEASMEAIPVDRLQKGFGHATKRPALIIGSGPSVKGFADGDFISYAAWSAKGYEFQPNFIGHCDHREQQPTGKVPQNGIIFTPVCSPAFLKEYGHTRQFVYFDRGNPLSWRFAEKRGLPDHNPIQAHVVDMLIQCAIYAGHKEIKLIGCDLSCKTLEELQRYHSTVTEAFEMQNYRGDVVYSDEIFDICRQSIEDLAKAYPEIQFSNISDQGAIIEGVPYEEV